MAASASVAARVLRVPGDVRAGARDERLWRDWFQFEHPIDNRDADRPRCIHRYGHVGQHYDLGRRESDRPVDSTVRRGGTFSSRTAEESFKERFTFHVARGVAGASCRAILCDPSLPRAEPRVETGLDGRSRRRARGIGAGGRDSRRWVYRRTDFSAGRPDSSERSNTGP